MADDRMKNDDFQRNMGANREDQNYGQQSPGKAGQGGQQQGQQAGGQQGGQFGGQKGTQKHQMEEDDELNSGGGVGGYCGSQNRGGGQNQ